MNGLAVFCGKCVQEKIGKEKKLSIAFEPFLPLQHSLYKCDEQFHTNILKEQLSDNDVWGFVIVDGDGTSFHTLCGRTHEMIFEWNNISLPKKHGRGGQSKQRFERIRDQKRGWYLKEVADTTLRYFIDSNTTLPNIVGLIVAGFANLKNELVNVLDQRLLKKLVSIVDVQYSGEQGFKEAITASEDCLMNIKYVKEQKIISKLFETISKDGNYCIGYKDTIYALESGVVELLIVWDKMDYFRSEIKIKSTNEKKIIYHSEKQQFLENQEIITSIPLFDWILDNYASFGAKIEFVSDGSSIGDQFVNGFGGIAGLLRYNISLPSQTEDNEYDDYELIQINSSEDIQLADKNLIVDDNEEDLREEKIVSHVEENTELGLDESTNFVDNSKEHVNLVLIGSVDVGKSTLGGKILYDSGVIDDRTIEKYEFEAEKNNRGSWFLAYIMDTNEDEREKGKTVEIGRACFNTNKKRYTIIDTPGHKSFITNMIMGTSQADIGILVISARTGEFEAGFENDGQSREHCLLAKILGIKKLIVCINKMDDITVQWSQYRYNEIIERVTPFLKEINFNMKDVSWIPVSAFYGDNIIKDLNRNVCEWYKETSLIKCLDNMDQLNKSIPGNLRIPVLDTYREEGKTHILGKVECGIVNVDDTIMITPLNIKFKVLQIVNDEGLLKYAGVGENIRIVVKSVIKSNQIDDKFIRSGFMVSHEDNFPTPKIIFSAIVQFNNNLNIITNGYQCIMHAHMSTNLVTINLIEELDSKGKILQKNPNFIVNANVVKIVKVHILVDNPIVLEPYNVCPQLGRFVLRDDKKTIAFGKIIAS